MFRYVSLFGKWNIFVLIFWWAFAHVSLSFSEFSLAKWVSHVEAEEAKALLLGVPAPDLEVTDNGIFYLSCLVGFIVGSFTFGWRWYAGAANAGGPSTLFRGQNCHRQFQQRLRACGDVSWRLQQGARQGDHKR